MLDIGFAKGHPETDLFQALDVLDEAFLFLVIDQVGGFRADFRIVDHRLDRQGRNFHPLAVFPVFAILGHFTEIDFRIEVRGEGLAMIAGIAVDNVDIFDLVEQEFLRIGAIDIRHARIEAAAENGRDALVLELVLVGPLPGIFELRDIARLVVRRVHIIAARFQAGIHDRQVLIRQGHVDQQIRLHLVDERDDLRNIVGVDLADLDRCLAQLGDLLAAFQSARGKVDMLERVAVHRAFLRDDGSGGTGTDDENIVHE